VNLFEKDTQCTSRMSSRAERAHIEADSLPDLY
jgi:hypothetical protein